MNLTFPHPVNEYAARIVAFFVLILTASIILTDNYFLLFFLLYGFIARTIAGPTLSPMGLLATKVFIPLFNNKTKLVAGPPKQFAQSIGLIFALLSIISYFVLTLPLITNILLIILMFFAGLESIIGFCSGCFMFKYLMKFGLVSQKICDRCNNFSK